MRKLLIMGIIALVAILGALTYLGVAGTAIMYALGGANDSPKKRRLAFGILGMVMVCGFVCAVIYLQKNGWGF